MTAPLTVTDGAAGATDESPAPTLPGTTAPRRSRRRRRRGATRRLRIAFLPLALLALALLGWSSVELASAIAERGRLEALLVEQEPMFARATKVHADLDNLADQTARLAAYGNANARRLLRDMRERRESAVLEDSSPSR